MLRSTPHDPLTHTRRALAILTAVSAAVVPLRAVAVRTRVQSASLGQPRVVARFPAGVFQAEDGTTVTLDSVGTMEFIMPTTSWGGRYRVRHDTVWVADESPACAHAGEGRYRWAFDGVLLTLTMLADPCEPRFVAGPLTWRRVSIPTPPSHPLSNGAPGVVIVAHDDWFEAPDTIAAGLTTLSLRQRGQEAHEVDVLRLDGRHSLRDVEQAVSAHSPMPWAVELGGVAALAPGHDAVITLRLPAGTYVLLCGLHDSRGVVHSAKGMAHALTAVGSFRATPPVSDVTVRLSDYAFTLSGPVAAGSHLLHVRNVGRQRHMLVLLRLTDGKSLADAMTWGRTHVGPPPAVPIGGAAEMDPQHDVFLPVTLAAGRYLLMCYSDAPDGAMHVTLGMAREIAVAPTT